MMKNGTAPVENSLAVPQKNKHRIIIGCRNSTSRDTPPKKLKTGTPIYICTPMFIAALFTIAKMWKQSKWSLTENDIFKKQCIHTIEYYTALRKNGIPKHATMDEP